MVLLCKIEFLAGTKNILVCPLDWGLGHATRCVPIIRLLHESGQKVIIAADRAPLDFLKNAFPKLQFVRFPGFKPKYSHGNQQILTMLRAIPSALRSFAEDHHTLECLIDTYQIDGLISDNRFGAWSKKVPSVFITHQLHIQLPNYVKPFKSIVDQVNAHYIRKFDSCWVPDVVQGEGLSGVLSANPFPKTDTRYIGPLSRFEQQAAAPSCGKTIDLLIMLSGPEPQRSLLETKILQQIRNTNANIVLLRGLPGQSQKPAFEHPGLTIYNHADDGQIIELVHSSKKILARSGYSTIMDLTRLQIPAFVIPTPGQTEQVYLAKSLAKKNWLTAIDQNTFDLNTLLNNNFDALIPTFQNDDILRQTVDDWLNSL